MRNRKLLAIPFILIFVIYDVIIVEGIFARLNAWNIIHVYHEATYCMLIPSLILICMIGFKSWKFGMYASVGIWCGWLDLLYFILQGKQIPKHFPWLYWGMSVEEVIFLASFSLTTAIIIDFITSKFYRRLFANEA